ncbi:MAG: PAS domain-containing sensor histidine kinase [Bacteroidota bacterium]|nr:PAS domain-containing sensor histidine kinase [Bacteroidota bacterium]
MNKTEKLEKEFLLLKKENAILKNHYKELEIIKNTINNCTKLSNIKEIYRTFGETIHELNPQAFIVLSLYDKTLDSQNIREIYGAGSKMQKIINIIGKDPRKIKYETPDFTEEQQKAQTSGKIIKIKGGIHEASLKKIPKTISKILEKTLSIGKIYALGFAMNNKPFGNIIIFLKKGNNLEHPNALQTLSNHFSVEISRKISEEKLLRSNEIYTKILNNINARIYVADMQTYKLLFVNKNIKESFGEINGQKCYKALQNLNSPCSFCTNKKLIEGKPYKTITWEHQNNIDKKWYKINNSKIKWFDGEFVRLELATDITEQKQTENKLKENSLKLKELNETKDKFFSIIGHDIKSPFNSIIGFAKLIIEDFEELDEEEVFEMVNIILKASTETNNLLDKLLLWASTQNGRIEIHPKENDIFEIISTSLLHLISNIEKKKIKINNSAKENTIAFFDNESINTVVRNLLSNAIKYSNQGGEINLSTTKNSNSIILTIEDKGIGMSKETIDNLFKIDKKISVRGTNNEKGTGLGLLICKEFIELNNGKISIESTKGKGSVFSLTLPLTKNDKII